MKQEEFVGNIESFSNKFINQQKLKNMKRLSFLLMAVVCVIFFSCGEDEDKQVHSITAFAGYGGAIATADKEIAVAGEAITVTATPAEGFLFKEWKIRVGNTVIENVQANPSTFTMPMEDVVIVATFMIRNDVLERITDPALKAYGVLSPDEASAVKAIDITGGVNGVKIKSVNELTEFTGLEVLKISGNELTTLNVVWSQLAKLDCSHNELTDLSVGGSGKLKELYCNNNHLSSLKLKTMVYENGYMLHCGNQVTEEGEVQILEAIMTDEQISFWESNLKNLSENANVDTKTMPAADVHLTLTKAVKYQFGNLMLILRDDNGNSVQVTLKSTELKPGEYSKDQMSSAYVTISGGGSYRNLDSDDPGSFTVKYDEGTGIYTIEGVLILQPNVSYPSVNVVRFEYVGAI